MLPSGFFSHQKRHLTQLLLEQLARPVWVDMPRVHRWLERFMKSRRLSLSAQQQQAVEMAAQSRVMGIDRRTWYR